MYAAALIFSSGVRDGDRCTINRVMLDHWGSAILDTSGEKPSHNALPRRANQGTLCTRCPSDYKQLFPQAINTKMKTMSSTKLALKATDKVDGKNILYFILFSHTHHGRRQIFLPPCTHTHTHTHQMLYILFCILTLTVPKPPIWIWFCTHPRGLGL